MNRKFTAGVVLAIIFGFISWLIFFQTSVGEKLFAKHFELDPGILNTAEINSDYDLFKGMLDYKEGKYDLAIKRWEALADIDPKNDTVNYFLGVSYLASDEFEKAKNKLDLSISEGDGNYDSEINLYLGLIEIRKGNLSEAKEYLQKSNLKKAKEILSELK